MISEQYIWLTWSLAFLIPWLIIYLSLPQQRKAMLWTSVFTMPFGLTEPLFVPEYWFPPSLFDLAEKTGFDIETFLFCFGIGGVSSVSYNAITKRTLTVVLPDARNQPSHRHHYKALSAPFVAFPLFYFFPGIPSILQL